MAPVSIRLSTPRAMFGTIEVWSGYDVTAFSIRPNSSVSPLVWLSEDIGSNSPTNIARKANRYIITVNPPRIHRNINQV